MVKYFKNPFANSGDKTIIPNAVQPSGSVSYDQGFGPDYQKDLFTDPSAKPYPRNETNQLSYDVTSNLKQYQEHGVPEFITSADNDGTPFPYDRNSIVRFNDGVSYKNYISLVDGNSIAPNAPATPPQWAIYEPAAFQNSVFSSGITSGSSNTYALSLVPAVTSLSTGLNFKAIINASNTGAATLNVNGLGATPIKVNNGISLVGLIGGELLINTAYEFFYDGTNLQVLNPSVRPSISSSVYFAAGGAGQSLPGGSAETLLKFDTVEFDPYSMWDSVNHKFNILKTGKYRLNATILSTFSTSVGAGLWIIPYINGTVADSVLAYNNYTSSGSSDGVNGTDIIQLNQGDSLDLRFHNDSTAATSIATGSGSPITNFMALEYLGN